MREAISRSNTKPSVVLPSFPMPLPTSTLLTTVNEPGIVLEVDFLLREEGSMVMW